MTKQQERKTLNAWRKERGLSIGELAARAGLTEVAINDQLYRGKEPRAGKAAALAAALKV